MLQNEKILREAAQKQFNSSVIYKRITKLADTGGKPTKSEWQELKMGGGTEETSNISDSSDSTDTNDGGTNVIYDGMVMTKNFNGTNGKIKL